MLLLFLLLLLLLLLLLTCYSRAKKVGDHQPPSRAQVAHTETHLHPELQSGSPSAKKKKTPFDDPDGLMTVPCSGCASPVTIKAGAPFGFCQSCGVKSNRPKPKEPVRLPPLCILPICPVFVLRYCVPGVLPPPVRIEPPPLPLRLTPRNAQPVTVGCEACGWDIKIMAGKPFGFCQTCGFKAFRPAKVALLPTVCCFCSSCCSCCSCCSCYCCSCFS